MSINIFIVTGRGKGDSRKIKAEAATPCLSLAWIRLGIAVARGSVKVVTGFLRWNAQLRIQDKNCFSQKGPCLSFFFFFPRCFLPFSTFASVEAEERRETRCHVDHILILPFLPCYPPPPLASLQLRVIAGRTHSPRRLPECSSLSGTGLISLSAVELLQEYL